MRLNVRDCETVKSDGLISKFDVVTGKGWVTVDGTAHSFHSSSFSCQPTRFPQSGEHVEVVLAVDSTGPLILAVRAR